MTIQNNTSNKYNDNKEAIEAQEAADISSLISSLNDGSELFNDTISGILEGYGGDTFYIDRDGKTVITLGGNEFKFDDYSSFEQTLKNTAGEIYKAINGGNVSDAEINSLVDET